MTLILKLGLDMVKMSRHTKSKVSMSKYSKGITVAGTNKHTV